MKEILNWCRSYQESDHTNFDVAIGSDVSRRYCNSDEKDSKPQKSWEIAIKSSSAEECNTHSYYSWHIYEHETEKINEVKDVLRRIFPAEITTPAAKETK
jgi:hypothetical protein